VAEPSIRDFLKQFPDDRACLAHLFESRFGQDYLCPVCQKPGKWYPMVKRRGYACQWCGHHLYPCAGTPFESSRTPLTSWFFAVYLFTTSRHGVAAKELERQLGVTYKTAWRMAHEIRKHMAAVDGDPPLSGHVEVDETYVGGVMDGAGRGRGLENKAVLLGMVKRGGHLTTKVIEKADRDTVMRAIGRNVRRGSTVHTDEGKQYRGLAGRGYKHMTVNHSEGEYAREDGAGTNTIEGAFSRLKNSIRGTHVHVSKKHLPKYAGGFEYRYNRRKRPASMLPELLSKFPSCDE
jgi:transposase